MKRIVQTIIAVCVVVTAIILAAPLLLSSERVKLGIEKQLSDITGVVVVLSGESSLSFSPYLGVSYRNVSLSRDQEAETPFVRVSGLKARVSLLSVLTGKPSLSEVRLVRPEFDLHMKSDGTPNWWSQDGPLARRLAPITEVNEAPEKPLALGTLSYKTPSSDGAMTDMTPKPSSQQSMVEFYGNAPTKRLRLNFRASGMVKRSLSP